MKTIITVDDVMAMRPCKAWTRKRIEAIGTSMSVCDAARLEAVSAEDRLWLLLRPEYIDERTLHLLACRWAEAVLPIYERRYPGDHRLRVAVATKRRWLDGVATVDELKAAAYTAAARAAAYTAASAAYTAAARAAAYTAASAAYTAAAYTAASAAYTAAARAASAARSITLADVQAVLDGVAVDDLGPCDLGV